MAEQSELTDLNVNNPKERLAIRITDKGAIIAITHTIDTLLHISSILRTENIKTTEELVVRLRGQLKKFLSWLDRVPDGSLYKEGVNKDGLSNIRNSAKQILKMEIIPSERDIKKWNKRMEKIESDQDVNEDLIENRIIVMTDTSFLLSYLSDTDSNALSVKVIVNYLKTQRRHFDLYLPNLVLLELISKLKQKYPFKKARAEFRRLLDEITDSRVAIREEKISLFNIFNRYEQFSKKKLSSRLRSNDFIIATDGIIAKAMILTCDRKMPEGIKQTYQNVFLINNLNKSYLKFITRFEKQKEIQFNSSKAQAMNLRSLVNIPR